MAKSTEDLGLLEKLAGEIWCEHYTPIIGPGQVSYMLHKFQSLPAMQQQIAEGYEYFLLWEKDTPIGYLSFQQREEELFLSKIYLLKNHRGRGLGKLMLEFVEEQVRSRGLKGVRLTVNKNNTNSIAAYLKTGFVKTRPVVIDIGKGYVMDDFEMLKEL